MAADAKLAAHPRKSFAGSLSGADGHSPGTNPANGFALGSGLASELGLHGFSDGAPLPHKGPPEANPFLTKRQLEGPGEPAGPADKAGPPHGSRASKGREREPDSKTGHNLFISAAAVPPGSLLGGPGLVSAAPSAGSTAPASQAHRPFLGTFGPGPQFAMGPVSLQASLSSVAGSSVLQSLFGSVPAAAGLVHVSSAAARLTTSHTMGSFSSGVAGGAVGGN